MGVGIIKRLLGIGDPAEHDPHQLANGDCFPQPYRFRPHRGEVDGFETVWPVLNTPVHVAGDSK